MHPNFWAWALEQGDLSIRLEVKRSDGATVVRDCLIANRANDAKARGIEFNPVQEGKLFMDEIAYQASKMVREGIAMLSMTNSDGTKRTEAEAIALYGDPVGDARSRQQAKT